MRRFLKHNFNLVHLPQPLYIRRMGTGGLTGENNLEKAKSHFTVIARFLETFRIEELFPDVNWTAIQPERRIPFAHCLVAAVYRAIGRNYCKSNVPLNAAIAFDQACSILRQCLQNDPGNQQATILLDQCDSERKTLQLGSGVSSFAPAAR
jgi:hypothetical protein